MTTRTEPRAAAAAGVAIGERRHGSDSRPGDVSRSERILDAAMELFRAHGYHSVGIDDIGARAGISGPGVYRHFRSKPSLLVELFTRASERLVVGGEDLVRTAPSPRVALERLIAFHVDFALDDRALIAVYMQEMRNLTPEESLPFRRRQRRYVVCWTDAVAELRPDLDADEVTDAVHGAMAFIASVATHEPRARRDRLERLLSDGALSALLTTPPT